MKRLLLAVVLAGCNKPSETRERPETPPVVTKQASIPSAEPAAATPQRKRYARVLHTGDSMVGGGLSRALGPKFEAEGVKYKRDVIESGTIHDFAQSDHLPKLMASFKPDLVLLTLGANHVPNSVDPEKEIGIFVSMLLKRVSSVDCYWIAPPIWKPAQAKFNDWLREHVAPCKFYDASALDIPRRPDKIHPNEKGGEVWADDLWKFMNGEGAFFEPLAPPL
jgi:lysophospholipase L1-like esterase